jgi:putative transport protein
MVGPEIDSANIADMTGEVMEVCVLNKEVVGKTLGQLGKSKLANGIFLRRATRQGHELPITQGTVIHKCDVLQLIGAKDDVEKAVKSLGYAERPTTITDLATVAVGCILGTLLGLIVVPVFGMPITLGVGGGVLVSGLLCGWLRSIHPTFGQIPGGAQWILSDLGLNLFVACIGVSAGPEALHAIQTTGLSVFLGGMAVTLVPIVVVLFFGLKILRMNPVLLFGAITGAHNNTASLNVIIEESNSSLPVLGYAAPYAFANVLLTVWGSVIINLM